MWFFFREIRISPSIGPTVAESLRAMLIPLYGRPMLSSITSIWLLPTIWRIADSTFAKSAWVCSIRVPAGRGRAGASVRRQPAGRNPCPAREQQERNAHQDQEKCRPSAPAGRRPSDGVAIDIAELVEADLKPVVDQPPTDCDWPAAPVDADTARDALMRASMYERIRYLNSTGTSVNESTRLASSDMHTDSDSGEKRYLAVPCSRNTGTKTMQMASVESSVGMPISAAPSMIAGLQLLLAHAQMPFDVFDHHGGVVHQDAHRQGESAERHRVERLAQRST